MGNIIAGFIVGIAAIVCFVLSYLQFHEKGFLMNNAYIYASQKERETMDKKPHYKQSGIVFLLIGIIFLLNTLEMIFETGWLFYGVIIIVVIVMIYAIVSSIIIKRKIKIFTKDI